ncbi:MAG: hypothetical protein HFG05_11140 [Oscillibacter sp.]|nr:hypothetical protein [Oscillibacter sp.]
MTKTKRRPGAELLRCTLCGRELLRGEEYWVCNGLLACGECLPDLARRELAPCREILGGEAEI